MGFTFLHDLDNHREGLSQQVQNCEAWHSRHSKFYHNNFDCQVGTDISSWNVRPGTGGKKLCRICEALS